MKCFYHSADLDGHCSGAVVKHVYPACEMIGINYGDPFPWEAIEENELVYMVDFSLQPFEDMVRLGELADLVWIDHHRTAILEAQKHPGFCYGAQLAEGKAGCELTWEYLHEFTPIPRAVYLLGRYDVWDHQDPDTLPFQYGLRMGTTDPSNPLSADLWASLFANTPQTIQRTIGVGKIVLEYQANQDAIVAKKAFAATLDKYPEYRVLALNHGLAGSKLFDSVWDPGLYDIMAVFRWSQKAKAWKFSIYTTEPEIDCGTIAKAYGGGGHPGAAGFQVEDIDILTALPSDAPPRPSSAKAQEQSSRDADPQPEDA